MKIKYLTISTLLFMFLAAGCQQPTINFVAQTRLEADGSVSRLVSLSQTVENKVEGQQIPLSNYMSLPSAEKYSNYKVTPDRVNFSGKFSSIEEMPIDFMKKTPGVNFWAQNQLKFVKRDYVLMTAYEYEERICDIVERAEAEESLKQAVNLLVEAIISTLKSEYGEKYDLSEFSDYLREVVPQLSMRLYHIYWETRRAGADSSVAGLNPVYELDHLMRKEVSHYGIALEPYTNKELRKKNDDILWAFFDSKLRNMVKAKDTDSPPLTSKDFKGRENQIKLLFKLLQEIQKSFGSVETFMQQLELPLVAGAFSGLTVPFEFEGNNLQLSKPEPVFNFYFKAQIPGQIIQTNALRDIDGGLIWRFSGDEVMFTGYRMWAKTLDINQTAVRKLGLEKFPGSIVAVEKFYSIISGRDGKANTTLLKLLKESVESGNLTPIEKFSTSESQVNGAGLQEDVNSLFDYLSQFKSKGASVSLEKNMDNSPAENVIRTRRKPMSSVLQKKNIPEKEEVKNSGPELE